MELRDPHLFILLAPELAGTAVTQFEELLTLLSSCFQPSDWEGRRERGAKPLAPPHPLACCGESLGMLCEDSTSRWALMMSMQTPGPLDDPGQLPACGILPYLFLGSQLLMACPPCPSVPLPAPL